MSNFSNNVDVERAKRELGVRRAETLQRHAEEIGKLDAERAELETLEKLLASFSQKFGGETGQSDVVDTEAATQPPPATTQPPPPPRPKYQQTNFEIFSRAASFGTF